MPLHLLQCAAPVSTGGSSRACLISRPGGAVSLLLWPSRRSTTSGPLGAALINEPEIDNTRDEDDEEDNNARDEDEEERKMKATMQQLNICLSSSLQMLVECTSIWIQVGNIQIRKYLSCPPFLESISPQRSHSPRPVPIYHFIF